MRPVTEFFNERARGVRATGVHGVLERGVSAEHGVFLFTGVKFIIIGPSSSSKSTNEYRVRFEIHDNLGDRCSGVDLGVRCSREFNGFERSDFFSLGVRNGEYPIRSGK